jgi:ParB/RepB/Spo0J family partition protein
MAKTKDKGISDLLEDKPENIIEVPTQHEIVNVDIEQIDPSTTNPRKTFDDQAIIDLADSIKAVGLLQPITLRPDEEAGGFEIVAGERRYRAALSLGWKTIPAIVRVVSDEQMLEIQIIENLQRENVSPLDEAAAFASLLKKESYDWLASKIHKSKKYIADRLKLNDLIESGRDYLRDGKLPLTHAIVIAKLPATEQEKAISYVMSYDFWDDNNDGDRSACSKTISELKNHIVSLLMVSFKDACFDLEIDNLVEGICACVVCPKRTANQNLLFDEITDDDKCTDAACYQAKEKAHIKLSMQAAKSKFEKGNVFSGEVSHNSNAITLQGITIPCSKTKTKGKEMAAVVITKTKYGGDKKSLGKTVYIDKEVLEKEKKKEEKKTPSSKNYTPAESYNDRQSRIYVKHKLPAIKAIGALPLFGLENGDMVMKAYIKEQLCNSVSNNILLSVAAVFGLYDTDLPEAEWYNIDDNVSHETIQTIADGFIEKFGAVELLLLLAMMTPVDDSDGDDKIRSEKERETRRDYAYNWPEIAQLFNINIKPEGDETKTAGTPKKKGKK